MRHDGVVTAGRLTHDRATVDDLSQAAPASQRASVQQLLEREAIQEAFVLVTCNRVEVYVVAPTAEAGQSVLESYFDPVDAETEITGHERSLRLLLRIAAGLESVVLGEDQILGQVRTAYADARAAGGIGPMLESSVTKAIHVGERARTETAINEGVVSLGSAAVSIVAEDRSLANAHALVVGAGEMGRVVARSLDARCVSSITIANRTVPTAEAIASELEQPATSVPLTDLPTVVEDVDVIIAATASSDPVLTRSHLAETEAVVVDLGQPRDVDPAVRSLSTIDLHDLDDIEALTATSRAERSEAAEAVEAMVDQELERLRVQFKRARADEVIAAMYESADRIKERELEIALDRLAEAEHPDETADIVQAMADSLVGQLLAPPTESLREAAAEDDWSTINTALQLFDPEFGPSLSMDQLLEEAGGDSTVEATEQD